MRGAVVVTVIMTYEDAVEIERRAEIKMLSEPQRWRSRSDAIRDEIGLDERTYLVPAGTRVLTVEPEREEDTPHVLPAVVSEVFVVGDSRQARRRYLHSLLLDELRDLEELEDEEDDEADE